MKTDDRVLGLLYDRLERFILLDELATAAATTTSSLKGALERIGLRGHEVEFSPTQGVRLLGPVELDAHLIERELGTRRIGRHVICFEEVDSTNDVAFDSARQADADGLVVLAQVQRKGRGRQGRRWVGPAGKSILMSVLLIDPQEKLAHEALTIAAGLAVAQGLEKVCPLDCRLKWPNDVLLDGAKLCGVLVEIREIQGRRCVVVGVGVNVNGAPPPDKVDAPATCLSDHLGHEVDRLAVVRGVLGALDEQVTGVLDRQLDELHRAWMSRCGMMNQRVSVLCGNEKYSGRVLDVSPMEGLVLLDDSGCQIHLPAEGSSIVK